LPTDFHGLARIEERKIGLGVMGYAFLPLSYHAVPLSGKKRKNAVPADWERIFTDGKIVGRERWAVGLKRKRLPTDFHGLARIIGLSAMGYDFLLLSYHAVSLSGKKRKNAVPADWERIFTDGRLRYVPGVVRESDEWDEQDRWDV